MASLSSRPLRQPPIKSSTSSTPQYGRVSRTADHKPGGSLLLFPTQPTANVRNTSRSLVHDGSYRGIMESGSSSSSRRTEPPQSADPPVAQPDEIRRRPQKTSPRTLRHNRAEPPSRTVESRKREPEAAQSSSVCLLKPDAPQNGRDSNSLPNIVSRQARHQDGTMPHQPKRVVLEESSTACEMSESSTGGEIHKEVRFDTVQVHYAEPGRRPTKAIELDTYENQRGPTRPPEFFLKSEAELRDVRRIRQIEDARAYEEWQAIRDINTEIQADVEERGPVNSSEEHGLGISFQGAPKKKKKWGLRGLFKRKQNPHPLADI